MLTYHTDALQTLFASSAEQAFGQQVIPTHSPGSVTYKTIKGESYAYWRVYQADGKRTEEYLGKRGDPAMETILEERQAAGQEMSALAKDAQLLRKAGFAAADNSAAVTVAAMFNAGIFTHGGVLVGAHAFGALLNHLGVRLPKNYSTEDVDIGSAGQISLAIPENRSFLDILRDSGLPFVEVPELDSRRPSTSFKVRGSKLKVDLLVPGTERYEAKPIPALKAHATGLPHFGYLMNGAEKAVILGRDHVIPVRVPDPARFALHKMIVSTLRVPTSAMKADKDLKQAAILIEALLDKFPDSVDTAVAALSVAATKRVAQGAARIIDIAGPFPDRTMDFLTGLAA
jgi:hypothetical protein